MVGPVDISISVNKVNRTVFVHRGLKGCGFGPSNSERGNLGLQILYDIFFYIVIIYGLIGNIVVVFMLVFLFLIGSGSGG